MTQAEINCFKHHAKGYGYTTDQMLDLLIKGFLERQIEMHDKLDDLCIQGFNRMGENDV